MKIQIDMTRCQGYGNCIVPSRGLLDFNDDGQAELQSEISTAEEESAIREAASMCPVSAITVEE